MYTQETTLTATSAPAVPLDTRDRELIKALATASAATVPCEISHCGGTGCNNGTTEKVVHAFGHEWFGENWGLGRLHDAIDSADHIRWVDDPAGYDLVVLIDSEHFRFQVKRPAQAEDTEDAA